MLFQPLAAVASPVISEGFNPKSKLEVDPKTGIQRYNPKSEGVKSSDGVTQEESVKTEANLSQDEGVDWSSSSNVGLILHVVWNTTMDWTPQLVMSKKFGFEYYINDKGYSIFKGKAAHHFRSLNNFKIKLGSKELAIGKPIANFLVNSIGRQGMSGVRYSPDNPKLQNFLNAKNFY